MPGPSPALRLALLWIAIWEPLAPASCRATWRGQWRGDLWHYAAWLARQRRSFAAPRLLARAASAPLHAFLLRLHGWSLHMLLHDLRFAGRMLARRPAFTAVAIAILGVGIGANATIFSWVETTLLSPMPAVPDQGRIVALRGTTPNRTDLSFSYLNYLDIRAAKPAGLEDIIAFRGLAVSLRADGEPVRVWGQLATANFFDVLRVEPALGRTFAASDAAAPGREAVAVISHALWMRQFNGDPRVVGRSVTLNGVPFTIVGVAAKGFRGSLVGVALDVFLPITMQPAVLGGDRLAVRGNSFLQVFGRLSAGASIDQVRASTAVVAARLAEQYPDSNRGRGIRVQPLWRDGASALMLPVMALLTGVVGVVLLIACANLAGLLLARAAGRQREVAVRLAVGASRGRLIRQFLVETALLALGGGAAGLILSYWTSGLLNGFLPPAAVPLGFSASLSPTVIGFSLATTALTAALVGLLPALRASRPDVAMALKSSSAGTALRRGWMRQALVVSQLAFSLMLLACAALFARSLQQARTLDPGFSLRRGFVAALELPVGIYDRERGSVLYRELRRRLQSIPGVASAAVTTTLPLDLSTSSNMGVTIDGYLPAAGEEVMAYYAQVGEGFFDTMGIAIVKGRALNDGDDAAREPVAVINETMAARYFKGRDPIGAAVRWGSGLARIVGVARDGKYSRLNEDARNYMYLSIAQSYRPEVALVVRTEGEPLALVNAIRAEVHRLDPGLPLFDVRTVEEYLQFSRFLSRMASVLLGVFGMLALLLAAVGLYSVIAFTVVQRTHEIGVRMALGADRFDVVTMVVRQGLRLTAIGLVVGSLLAAGVARAIGDQLVGVRASDPASWLVTVAVLSVTAALACVFPALHAASLDPLRALRRD